MTEEIKLNLGSDMDGDLPPLTIQEPPGFLRFMPPIVKQAASLGCTFKMAEDGMLYLDGFYKNGPMKIDFDDQGGCVAVDKRGRKTAIGHFDDLVHLNFLWWRISNGKKNEYVLPERPWIDAFIEKKWVKRKVIFEPIDSEVPTEDDGN